MTAAHPSALLHRLHGGGGKGLICFSRRDSEGWRDRLATVKGEPTDCYGEPDQYVSVAQFRPGPDRCRANDHVMSFGAVAIDLDRPDASVAGLVIEVLGRAVELGIPRPTGIVSTGGRGVHAYWCFDKRLPGRAAPRWRRLVSWLVTSFKADPACVDPARVFRLPGSVHGKTGRPCEIVFWSDETADFETLFERAVPLARAVLRAKKKARKIGKGTAKRRRERKRNRVLADLIRLSEAECGFREGQRNEAVHVAASLLSMHLVGTEFEAAVLRFGHAHTTPALKESEILECARSATSAHNRDGRGYRYSRAGIMRKLRITAERAEAAGLVTLVACPKSSAERKRLDRRNKGMRPQTESREHRAPWVKDGVSRSTYYRRQYRKAAALKRLRAFYTSKIARVSRHASLAGGPLAHTNNPSIALWLTEYSAHYARKDPAMLGQRSHQPASTPCETGLGQLHGRSPSLSSARGRTECCGWLKVASTRVKRSAWLC